MGHDEGNGLVLKKMNEDRGEMLEIPVVFQRKSHRHIRGKKRALIRPCALV